MFSLTRLYLPLFAILLIAPTGIAFAHVSEQAFVLLLPTKVYIASGVLVVILTIALLAFLPANWTHKLFTPKSVYTHNPVTLKLSRKIYASDLSSLASMLFLFVLLGIGFSGTHDPLGNVLPLFIWTIFWVAFVVLHGLFGNLWRWVNPWTGIYKILTTSDIAPIPYLLPPRLGAWPGVIVMLVFVVFALADLAPDAPQRLATVVVCYWLFTLLGVFLFGELWLQRVECFSMLLDRYAQLAPLNRLNQKTSVGFFGWLARTQPATTISTAIFILVLLGTGSFDGLNETFAWLAMIGVNPLEFPGRSAVVTPTVLGLLGANILLIATYAICVYLGLFWATKSANKSAYISINTSAIKSASKPLDNHAGTDEPVSFKTAFCYLAISMLPIAFVYHFAHYLTAFLVNGQYALAAASDPLANGQDLLGLGTFYVTTGFMNSHHSVQAIWLIQAAAVVAGHVLSVLLAHAIALDLFGSARRAIISQAPLAAFMVGYTFIGLWLLAAPKGA